MAGSQPATFCSSEAQAIASRPEPITGWAARYIRMVPNSASAMPTPHRMKYFHAASIASRVR